MGNVLILHIGAHTRVTRNASLVSATNYEPTGTLPRPTSLPLMSALVKIVKKKHTVMPRIQDRENEREQMEVGETGGDRRQKGRRGMGTQQRLRV